MSPRRLTALALTALLVFPAEAVEVQVPRARSSGGSGGQAGAAGGAMASPGTSLPLTSGLGLNLSGFILPLAGAPPLTLAPAPGLLLAAPAVPATLAGPLAAPAPFAATVPGYAELRAAVNPPAGYSGHDATKAVFWPRNVHAFLHESPGNLSPAAFAGIAAEYQSAKAAGRLATPAVPTRGTAQVLASVAAGKLDAGKAFEGAQPRSEEALVAGRRTSGAPALARSDGNPKAAVSAPQPGPASDAEHDPVLTLAQTPAWDERSLPRHIIFDVRGSRGGHGDVAAAYLTVYDMLSRLEASGRKAPRITFIADSTERRILGRLAGRGPVGKAETLFGGRVDVRGGRAMGNTAPPADLLVSLASGGEDYAGGKDLLWFGETPLAGPGSRDEEGRGTIPVSRRTVIMTQTVFGNTESARKGNAVIWVGGRRLEYRHAGLASGHAGVYSDPVARSLRGRPREEVRAFALAQAEAAVGPGAATAAAFLRGETFRGAQPGLVYGVTASETKKQFERYLEGLARRAAKGESFVLFTPSGVAPADIRSRSLRKRVLVLGEGVAAPEEAVPGRIYIAKTGTLPHPLFVSLMAFARPPPIVAGDGAMSAALALGRPFVMTQVDWNRENIRDFADRLKRSAPGGEKLIDGVYRRIALERAGELEGIAPAFAAVSDELPSLTDGLFSAYDAVRGAAGEQEAVEPVLGMTDDGVLQASILAMRAMSGDVDARRLAKDRLASRDRQSRRQITAALVRDAVANAIFPRGFSAYLSRHPVVHMLWMQTVDELPWLGRLAAHTALMMEAGRRRRRESRAP